MPVFAVGVQQSKVDANAILSRLSLQSVCSLVFERQNACPGAEMKRLSAEIGLRTDRQTRSTTERSMLHQPRQHDSSTTHGSEQHSNADVNDNPSSLPFVVGVQQFKVDVNAISRMSIFAVGVLSRVRAP